ncbi:MAG: hypothetical protein AAFN08_08920 [Cyanobacteria bacterium J06559_3]
MANYEITLPEETYRRPLAVAQETGLSPANWIASHLPSLDKPLQPFSNFLTGLVGAINSKAEPYQTYPKIVFG